jgi:hypothetical protein
MAKAKDLKTDDENKGIDPLLSTRLKDFKGMTYSDGHPLHELQYLQCKVILKGERFTSVQSFHEYGKLVAQAADKTGIDYTTKGFETVRPKIREVLFLDTKDFRLYSNSFILRRRLSYEDGFPAGEPEVVFKFRHNDLQAASMMDVRPNIGAAYKVKFKTELLPLKDKLGGYRKLYSHNVQFPLSALPDDHLNINIALTGRVQSFQVKEDVSMAALVNVLPALQDLHLSDAEMRVGFVNHTAVEEVLLDIGKLNFGKDVQSTANVGVWRTRGDQRQLVGEFAFQVKFNKLDDLHTKAMVRVNEFFNALQYLSSSWISLGTTKTGALYRIKGSQPSSHE